MQHVVSAVGDGLFGDLHEFKITEQDTALITVYHNRQMDCSALGIDSPCWINDCLFQEIDISTGDLLFEWRATDHVPFSDSYKSLGGGGHKDTDSYDFFHINSVDKDRSGNYYVSARHTHTVYCIGPDGTTLWYLGGKHNNFTDLSSGSATNFRWQHHATWHPNAVLTIFDNNGNNVFHYPGEFSRGMSVSLDTTKMTATLLESYVHPDEIMAISQGSMQVLPDNGNVFVGWGNSPTYTEFTADGEVLCSTQYGAGLFFEILDVGLVKSYRAFKANWVGRPKTLPDIAVSGGTVYVSWNGATEVAAWRLESAESLDADPKEFVIVQELLWEGFETTFEADGLTNMAIRVAALDSSRNVLGYSKPIEVKSNRGVSNRPIFLLSIIA